MANVCMQMAEAKPIRPQNSHLGLPKHAYITECEYQGNVPSVVHPKNIQCFDNCSEDTKVQ